jgi:thiol:disulfide interchange protein DsbD
LSFAPVLRRALPKPGAWMDTLKQLFAFPMYASAAWLLWVLAQQTSPAGLAAALAGLVLIALSAWAFQKSRGSMGGRRFAMLATSALAVGLALVLPTRVDAVPPRPSPHAAAAGGDEWQAYDEAKLKDIVASGKPVLVNFTAAWCLTCLVNERNAFSDPKVQDVFKRKGVVLMKGDWTNREPSVTSALAAFGRAGVPLYVVYNASPGGREPVVLPQLLTPEIVRDSFSQVADR